MESRKGDFKNLACVLLPLTLAFFSARHPCLRLSLLLIPLLLLHFCLPYAPAPSVISFIPLSPPAFWHPLLAHGYGSQPG